jgi:CBS domain-containing protein
MGANMGPDMGANMGAGTEREGGGAMLVGEWMTHNPVTVSPDTSVLMARRLLYLHRIRHLPVLDGDRLVGMVSDRDINVRDPDLIDSLSSLQSDLLSGRWRPIATVMSTPVQIAHPGDSLTSAARTLQHWRLGALPVVDGSRLVGILTTTDCLEALLSTLESGEPGAPAAAGQEDPPKFETEPDGGSKTPPPTIGAAAGSTAGGRSDRPARAGSAALADEVSPGALVIHPRSTVRLEHQRTLRAEGYEVASCPGPWAAWCAAVQGGQSPCPRLPQNLELIVMDSATARTCVPATYRRWAGRAAVLVTRELVP